VLGSYLRCVGRGEGAIATRQLRNKAAGAENPRWHKIERTIRAQLGALLASREALLESSGMLFLANSNEGVLFVKRAHLVLKLLATQDRGPVRRLRPAQPTLVSFLHNGKASWKPTFSRGFVQKCSASVHTLRCVVQFFQARTHGDDYFPLLGPFVETTKVLLN
jgi:hypothetical protein